MSLALVDALEIMTSRVETKYNEIEQTSGSWSLAATPALFVKGMMLFFPVSFTSIALVSSRLAMVLRTGSARRRWPQRTVETTFAFITTNISSSGQLSHFDHTVGPESAHR